MFTAATYIAKQCNDHDFFKENMNRNCMGKVYLHFKCRNSVYARSNIQRFHVPDDHVKWSVCFDDYRPVEYTAVTVAHAPWADPEIAQPGFEPKFNQIDGPINRISYCGKYSILNGRPLNPVGRTGMSGRGCLGRWGPNHAVDPIVTRWKCHTDGTIQVNGTTNRPILQFVSVLRGDSHEWAIPGGMVDAGELVTDALKREFMEEAFDILNVSSQHQKASIEKLVAESFQQAEVIYQGYVDDPRNTDNAWMETAAYNIHDETGEQLGSTELKAGSDAVGAKWTDISSDAKLYASHSEMLKAVAVLHDAHW
ncbi:ADP-ribose pyrophosphatase, mitochondrial [Trichinella patagoniensis]|uniref:ADP-ribose pyrophosphatase, mitochondrial n=1 Tax=Trichinella patagoniensis TaxID=990121 RepID=A0A0V1ADX4_9BILA|nr:ADP-ribose pyrophosphatase, mitochondrial [Trichinella patagoniensis]